ncbi:MAG: cell division protein FtsQ/DivIB [Pseudomonadota bacterium]
MARPRKGASRHESKPAKRRLEWRWLLPLLLLPPLVVGLWWAGERLLDPQTLPVRTVRIESPLQQLGREQIRQAVLPHVEPGFLWVDVDTIRGELEALPWVANASVRRTWPDVLVVQVEEQTAAARWSGGGLVNPQGGLFVPEDDAPWRELPLLRGPKGTQSVLMSEFLAMQGMLGSLGLRISHLTMNERRAWSLHLDNGLQLRLGRRDTHLRLLRFVRVYGRVLQPRLQRIDSVDLRYTNGFAVRWREGHSASA